MHAASTEHLVQNMPLKSDSLNRQNRVWWTGWLSVLFFSGKHTRMV